MKIMNICDPHVHMRGFEYPDHNFAQMALDDAAACGIAGLIEMPNCKPFLTNRSEIYKRYDKIKSLNNSDRYRRCHPCVSNVMDAIDFMRGEHPYSVKIFFAHSTGNLGVINESVQAVLWQQLADCAYKGVVIGHFEDESKYTGEFDPKQPTTHSRRQNPDAELWSVIKQIRNAYDVGFEGTFYCAHASNPETIDYLNEERSKVPFKIAIEVTWHHMFLSSADYTFHFGPTENRKVMGNLVKMNPPLRDCIDQEILLGRVISGQIDIIGSDHAPHPMERKTDPVNPASGIPALPFWPRGIEMLRKEGMHEGLIENVTFFNANRILRCDLRPQYVEVEYQPALWEKYGYNPFLRIDR